MALKKVPVVICTLDGTMSPVVWGYRCRVLDDSTNFATVPWNLVEGGARGYAVTHIPTGARAGFGLKMQTAIADASAKLQRAMRPVGETPDQCAIRLFKSLMRQRKVRERACRNKLKTSETL